MNSCNCQRIRVGKRLLGLAGSSRHYAIWLIAALFSQAALSAASQELSAQALSQQQVIQMLDRHTLQSRVESIVRQRGINFNVTAEVEEDLKKKHGASDDLISVLKQFAPQPPPGPTGAQKPQGTPAAVQPEPTRGSESDKATELQIPAGLTAEVANSYRKALGGDSHEMLLVGNAYRYGQGAPQDNKQAAYWFSKAAKVGDANSMNNLGFMYENGYGVDKDYGRAINWYREAAKAGNAAAMRGLGLMYQTGHGVPTDFAQAASWYRKAAQGGDAGGMINLGIMYEYGWGVQPDKQQAIYWYRKAAQLGSNVGRGNLERLGEKP